jgi:two-component system, cell cycle response regulator DivK
VVYRTNVNPSVRDRKSRFLVVVDNEAGHLAYLAALLRRFNYPSFTAVTAKEAIETVTTAIPLLVIISLDQDGFDLMRQLREHPATSEVPFIAVGDKEDPAVRNRCLEMGALGCLFHPVSAEMLYLIIQIAVEKTPRSYMRVQTNQAVKLIDEQHSFFGAYTLDLSERGMFLRTMDPAFEKAKLSLQINLNGRLITTEAEVLYRCNADEEPYQEPGVGLKFTRIEPKDQESIRRFIREEVNRGISTVGL